jgi:hypothetical protein
MKQETIEEALNYQLNFIHDVVRNKDFDLGFQTGGIFGAKWQAERMYSEEEVRLMLAESFKASQEGYNITSDEIIEQFKKK